MHECIAAMGTPRPTAETQIVRVREARPFGMSDPRRPLRDLRIGGQARRFDVVTRRDYIHQHEGASGVRRMLDVLGLAKKHGPVVVDDAAKAALDLGVPTYRFLRRYLNADCRRR